MVSAGFLYAQGDPLGVADRPFFVRMVGSSAERRVPRSAERERNEGSLEATASMEHAARRRGDPCSGSEADLGKRGI